MPTYREGRQIPCARYRHLGALRGSGSISQTVVRHETVGMVWSPPRYGFGESRSQMRIEVSALPVASRSPSGLKATAQTRPLCPESESILFREARSHTAALPSVIPVAIRVPSGLTATESIPTSPTPTSMVCSNNLGDAISDNPKRRNHFFGKRDARRAREIPIREFPASGGQHEL